jgi:predicted permease
METLLRDLRYGWRRLRRTPAFALIAILSLALGIGANTAIFSLLEAVMLRDLAVREPERILEIYGRTAEFPYAPFSIPDFRDLERATADVFSSSFGTVISTIPRDHGDRIETVPVELVTGDYFRGLGIEPAAGRLLSPEDDVGRGAHPVVVLSYGYWSAAYGRDPAAIGQDLRIDGRNYTIVGVVEREFDGSMRGLPSALYLPVQMINLVNPSGFDQLRARNNAVMFVRARLEPDVTMAQVEATLATFTDDMSARYDWPHDYELRAVRLSDIVVNPMLDRFIRLAAALLSVVVGLVLMIACANLASFLLAQARDRRREIAIRLSLGARRVELLRQLLTESVALAVAAGLVSLVFAQALLSVLLGSDLPLPFPITVDASLNPAVLMFALVASVGSGILFGLAPALQATRADVISILKDEAAGGPARRLTLRNALVVGQVGLSVLLLVTAGLFLRSLIARQAVDPGFGSSPTALLQVNLPARRYNRDAALALVDRLEESVKQIPGVQAVGVTSNLHLQAIGVQTLGVNVDGFQPPEHEEAFFIDHASVDGGFFDAAGIPILKGRTFDAAFDRAGGQRVAIINQVMADRFWSGQEVIGATFRSNGDLYTVIGVARNTKVRTLGEEPRPFIYSPFSQNRSTYVTLLARTTASAERTLPLLIAAARATDSDLTLIEARTMARHLGVMLLPARLAAVAFGAFAALALILALIGVFGVVSYAVTRRRREVGIRMSLGARPPQVVRMLVRDGLTLVAIGASGGLAIAFASARVLRSVLFGIEPLDPFTFISALVFLVAAGALAVWIPALRAGEVDPARVLKGD